ncbi:MAG TPA: hypothetical protein VI979_04150 [archaeon]|nr:hypothetical protein [archaeon]
MKLDFAISKVWQHGILIHRYLMLHADKYQHSELSVVGETSKRRLDVESVAEEGIYCVSELFKRFVESEGIPFDFFPIIVEGERRYLMMWRRLPVISDYEVDVHRSQYCDDGSLQISSVVFRSDIIEHLGYRIFNDTSRSFIFVTDALKEKLEKGGFLLGYKEQRVTEVKLEKEEVENLLLYATGKELEMRLVPAWEKELQAVDDYLEKVLIEEGNQATLERFRREMKGIWEKDFQRHENGLMEPEERITYW